MGVGQTERERGPHAAPTHERLVKRLIVGLDPMVPDGYEVIGSAMIELPPTYRVKDVTVLANGVFERDDRIVAPNDVLIAVEIESPTSLTADRVAKPAEYAVAGIAHYWRVETDPLVLTAYRLERGAYVEVGCWNREAIMRVSEPSPVELRLAQLEV